MRYQTVIPGTFLARPNRFVAVVRTEEGEQICHVKNTGRCRELLIPGTQVWLERADSQKRKTAFDLIAVQKGEKLINMDAQAPNRVFAEWAAAGNFLPEVREIRPEYTYGDSRLDFCIRTSTRTHLVEVKGVTLEENGIARFPDAPTERGVRHLHELCRAVAEGLDATLFFVVQMEGVHCVLPNDATHPEFGRMLRQAASSGVRVEAWDCAVRPDNLVLRRQAPVLL